MDPTYRVDFRHSVPSAASAGRTRVGAAVTPLRLSSQRNGFKHDEQILAVVYTVAPHDGHLAVAGGAPEYGTRIRCQVRQVVSASTPPCLASPTSMRPATLHCVILRGPPLQGRVRPRRWRRLGRHADEGSGHEVSRPASPLPCHLSFLATSRIPTRRQEGFALTSKKWPGPLFRRSVSSRPTRVLRRK
jgi:hypothetical protein